MTPIVVHMHIFKNAGTSLDAIFKSIFQERYSSFDLDRPGARIGLKELQDFIAERPDTRYVTSHQVGFPLPVLAERPIFPVFMLRDPFERVPSCYYFERDVQGRVAENMSLDAYVRRHLSSPFITATIGLQCQTLSDIRFNPQLRRDYLAGEGLKQAVRNMQSTPVFGLVERFEESAVLILRFLEQYFPGIESAAKVDSGRMNQGTGPVEARSDARAFLRENLARETYRQLADELRYEDHLVKIAQRAFDNRWRQYAELST